MNAKKYLLSVGRILLASAILELNISLNNNLENIPKIYDNSKNKLLERVYENNLIDFDFLADTNIKPLNEYELLVSGKYEQLVSQIYDLNKKFPSMIDKNLVIATIHEESSFKPKNISKIKVKRKWINGARGLMQVMKPTWKDYSKKRFEKYAFIPAYNVNVGIKHLFLVEDSLSARCPNWPKLSEKEKIEMISSAYNGGQNLLEEEDWNLNKMPEESKLHGDKVWNRYNQYKKEEIKKEYFNEIKNYIQKEDTSFKKLNRKNLEEILKLHLKLKKLSEEI
jgi:hypothetical protein